MNNQEAIEVMFNEWKCIDRNDGINCDRKCESCDLVMDVQTIREAFNMAISALESQEAKHSIESSLTQKALDTISRQAAIDELKRISFSHYFECGEYLSEDTREIKIISSSKALEVIEALPPAQPAPQNDSDRIYAMMKDYYFEHKDEHDVSWQGGFGKCMNLIPNVIEKKAQPEPLVKESRTLVKDLVKDTISRQAAIDILDAYQVMVENGEENPYAWARLRMSELPPAQPERNNHTVACMLAELFDDTCACNYNGIDEWLPSKCELLDSCPNPAGVACWEQFLKHRAERRTDEGD